MSTSFWEDPWLKGFSLDVFVFGFRGCSMFLAVVNSLQKSHQKNLMCGANKPSNQIKPVTI